MIFKKRRNGLKHSPYPGAVGYGVLAVAKVQTRAWNAALANIEKTQRAQLSAQIEIAKDTEYGRRYNFDKLRSYEDYRAAVPLGDYDSFSPHIDRMREGARNVLVPGFVEYFGCSSGSSNRGKIKYLPITNRQIKHQAGGGSDVIMRFLAHRNDTHFTDGYSLGLLAPTKLKREGPVWVTSNPALGVLNMPRVGRVIYLPDPETMEIEDYEEKMSIMVERYLDHDVRLIAGTTCWFSVLFDRLLDEAKRRGRKVSTVREVWPNLECMVGGGVAAGPYEKILQERLGRDDVTLIDTYNATEGGLYAATDPATNGNGMLMIPHRGVFFEFVPVEVENDPYPTRVPLWEVETDRLYHIVVTTPSGMYAYMLGDYVRFASLHPLRIEFVGRKQGCLSTSQELTTHLEIQKAFEGAVGTAGGTAVDFATGADVGINGSGKARYVLFAEFEPDRLPEDLAGFARAFDDTLCDVNRVYKEYREGDTLIFPPELVVLPKGSVNRYLAEEGNGNVQSKFPRIVDDARKAVLRSFEGQSTFLS